MRDDAVLRRALPLGRGLGPLMQFSVARKLHRVHSTLPTNKQLHMTSKLSEVRTDFNFNHSFSK